MKLLIKSRLLFPFFLLILSVCFFIPGMKNLSGLKKISPASGLALSECKKGKYLSVKFTELLPVYFDFLGSTQISLSSQNINGKEAFAIPVKGGKYINCLISDSKKIEKLKEYKDGFGEGVTMIGKLDYGIGLNYTWLKRALRVETNEEVDNLVEPIFVIREVSKMEELSWLYAGLCFFLLSIIVFFLLGGKKGMITIASSEGAVGFLSDFYFGFSRKPTIEELKKGIELCMLRREQLRKNAFYSLLLLPIGFLLLSVAGSLLVFALSFICFGYTLFFFLKWFLNSDLALARKLARILPISSISEELMTAKKGIERIKEAERILKKNSSEEKEDDFNC